MSTKRRRRPSRPELRARARRRDVATRVHVEAIEQARGGVRLYASVPGARGGVYGALGAVGDTDALGVLARALALAVKGGVSCV